jgi:U4/U6 small nuclear ribonucleoprotein PRP31
VDGEYLSFSIFLEGGIVALSKIPSCNVQVIGQEKKHLAGNAIACLFFSASHRFIVIQFRNEVVTLLFTLVYAGFAKIAAMPHTGILYYCDLIQSSPPFIRRKLLKVVAGALAFAVVFDFIAILWQITNCHSLSPSSFESDDSMI